jgi:snapalysin
MVRSRLLDPYSVCEELIMVRILRLMATMVLASATVVGVSGPASAAPASPLVSAGAAPTVIPIDLLLAGSYTDAARQAIVIWNQTVPSIRFVEQPTAATLRIKEYKTEHGVDSHAVPQGLGRGWVFAEVGDAQIYNPVRVVVHELGHVLSLPDIGQGDPILCSKVMSGGHAGPECRNAQPDAAEAEAVAGFFATHELGDPIPGWGGLD